MARLPALIDTYAQFDERPRKTIEWIARVLREDPKGYIASTKRGVGAAHMSATDAVNLILACSVANEAKDGPSVVERMRAFRRATDLAGELAHDLDERLLPVFKQRSLGLALEAMIGSAAAIDRFLQERFERVFATGQAPQSSDAFKALTGIHVALWRSGASISVWDAGHGPRREIVSAEYGPTFDQLIGDSQRESARQNRRVVKVILPFQLFKACSDLLGEAGQTGV